jgi:hypothetical protein
MFPKKNKVTVTSMYHGAETQIISKSEKQKKKPVCILYYKQYMGGVNLKD